MASLLGTGLGLFSAVSGKALDESISRVMDALLSIPNKIFALVMIAALGSSIPILLLITAITYTPGVFPFAGSLAVNINQMDYIQVARAREGRLYLASVEVLPNMIHPMLTDFGLRFVYVVLLLSSLSFLGLGVQPPNADLGSLVRENICCNSVGGRQPLYGSGSSHYSLTIGVNLFIDSLRSSR